MKTIYFSCLCLLLALPLTLSAQSVSGTVVDSESNEALIGAIVRNETTGAGTTTNTEGIFTIEGAEGDEINVSYIGFLSKTLIVGQDNFSEILLSPDETSLENVVVIGYGKQEKAEVTGSVSTVNSQTIEEIQPFQATEALQGTTPGVNVTQTSGAPGAGLNIRIRGVSTNNQNEPIAIIDGYQGDLSLLNPDDIESITVLKDAQAAIYGTIGANGVILVTTKSGRKNQKPQFSINSYYGFQETTRTLPVLNSQEYAILLNETYASSGESIPFPNLQDVPDGADWQNEVFDSQVPTSQTNISVSGGGENNSYIVSGSFLDQNGIIGVEKSGFYRGTGRAGVSIDLSEKFRLNSNFIYTGLGRKSINENGLGSVLFNALNAPPTLSAYTNTGDYSLVPNTTGLGIEVINPLAQVNNTYNDYILRKLNGNLGLDYDVLEGLTVTGRFGFNTTSTEGRDFGKQISYGGKVFDVTRSSVSQNAINDNNYSVDLFAEYNKTIEDVHNLGFTLGSTYFKEYGNGLYATGFDVPNNSWEYADISLATGTSDEGVRDVSSYNYDERRVSQFGRLQYDFVGKYLLSAMLRRDLSTKFGPNNQEGIFPSATAGWIISEEQFFTNNIINFLKLRGSYGVLGNDQIPNLGYVGSLDGEATYVFDNQLVIGRALGQLPNPDLQWEESKKLDIGFDADLWENKLNVVADYFDNRREKLLISNIPVSGIVGTAAPGGASPTINAGTVQNKGFEFALNYRDEIGSDFTYDVGYNFTKIDNEVLLVDNQTGFIEGGAFGVGQPLPVRMQEGYPIGYFYGYKTDGILQNIAEVQAHADQSALGASAQPGDLRYVDMNNDGQITPEDRVNIGDPIPDVTMGLNLRAGYRNFKFHVYTYSQLGNDMIRNYERALSDVNQLNYRLDRWRGEGTSNSVPRVTAAANVNNVFSDYYVEDASFLRIQTAQIGYTVPVNDLGSVKLREANVYVKGNNLATLTKYRGYDPGATTGAPIGGGIDYGFYPLPRTVMFGINLKF